MGYIISLLMILNVIITWESVYNLPAFIVKHANDEQYNVISRLCSVNTGSELPRLSLLNAKSKGRKPGRDTSLSPWEEQRCHQACGLLTLVLLSN